MKRFSAFAVGVLVMVLLATSSDSLQAQTLPYIAFGTNAKYMPATGDYQGKGTGIPFLKQTIKGNVIPELAPPPEGVFITGTFSGEQVTIPSFGGKLKSTLSGNVELTFVEDMPGLVEGTWYPNFEIQGGTGIFKKASGSLTGIAINPPLDPTEPEWPFDWFIYGTIDLGWF